jgi:HlyD family secretion protein
MSDRSHDSSGASNAGGPSADRSARPAPSPAPRRIPHGRIIAVVAAATLAVVAAVWFGDKDNVPAVVVAAAPFAPDLRSRGRLDARVVATVGADAPARVEAVLVDIGDTVRVGDALVRLDADVSREQLRSATAAAASASDGVRSAKAELASATLRLAERKDDHERISPLAGTAVPAAEVSTARIASAQAQTDVDRAAARLAQAEAQADAAAADRATAERRLADLILRAPIAGVVVARSVTPGDVVAAGAPLLRITDPATLEIVAYIDESVMHSLHVGLPTRVAFNAADGDSVGGTVKTIGREVDPETREVEVRIALGVAPDLWALGQRVEVRIDTKASAAATTVPTEMVAWQGSDPGVYVADRGRTRWVPVQLGRPRGERVEVTRGVRAGDTVLAPSGLQAGQRVAPVVGGARRAP